MCYAFVLFQDDGVEENGHPHPMHETQKQQDVYIPQSSLAVRVSLITFCIFTMRNLFRIEKQRKAGDVCLNPLGQFFIRTINECLSNFANCV